MLAFEVVDIGEEIALNVEDDLQLCSTVQSRLGQRRLADQRDSFGNIAIDVRIACRRAVMPDNLTELFKSCFGWSVKNEVDGTRMRIKQNQWTRGGIHG